MSYLLFVSIYHNKLKFKKKSKKKKKNFQN